MLKEALQGDCVLLDEADLLKLLVGESAQLLAGNLLQHLTVDVVESKLLGTPVYPTLYLLFSPLQGICMYQARERKMMMWVK